MNIDDCGVVFRPPEANPSTDCIPKDTCPDGGPDPIFNYMDGSPEACQTGFTAGVR